MKNILLISACIVILMSCDKDNENDKLIVIDCDNLKTSLLSYDSEQLDIEVDKLTQDLTPIPSQSDVIGHLENLNELIKRLNYNCNDIIATKICYACIKTLPAQSEIKVELDSVGTQVERIIDISTPYDSILVSSGMHGG